MKKLPIGISTFEKIRTDDCYYVDKTYLRVFNATVVNAPEVTWPTKFGDE